MKKLYYGTDQSKNLIFATYVGGYESQPCPKSCSSLRDLRNNLRIIFRYFYRILLIFSLILVDCCTFIYMYLSRLAIFACFFILITA